MNKKLLMCVFCFGVSGVVKEDVMGATAPAPVPANATQAAAPDVEPVTLPVGGSETDSSAASTPRTEPAGEEGASTYMSCHAFREQNKLMNQLHESEARRGIEGEWQDLYAEWLRQHMAAMQKDKTEREEVLTQALKASTAASEETLRIVKQDRNDVVAELMARILVLKTSAANGEKVNVEEKLKSILTDFEPIQSRYKEDLQKK